MSNKKISERYIVVVLSRRPLVFARVHVVVRDRVLSSERCGKYTINKTSESSSSIGRRASGGSKENDKDEAGII